MAKGYWISTGTIHTPLAMVPYISQLTEWLPTVGAKFLVRDVQCDVREGCPGSLNVIIEFPSLESAVSAYESTAYQSLIELRTPHSDLCRSQKNVFPKTSGVDQYGCFGDLHAKSTRLRVISGDASN